MHRVLLHVSQRTNAGCIVLGLYPIMYFAYTRKRSVRRRRSDVKTAACSAVLQETGPKLLNFFMSEAPTAERLRKSCPPAASAASRRNQEFASASPKTNVSPCTERERFCSWMHS